MQTMLFVGAAPAVPAAASQFGGTRLRSTRFASLGMTMRVGIPRVFGGTGRVKKVEVVETVPLAEPTEPALSPWRDPVPWARAHPLQVVLIVLFGISSLRKAVAGLKGGKEGVTEGEVMPGGLGPKSEASRPGLEKGTAAGTMRAMPRRHETTVEALDLLGNSSRKYIIVGGKGGVGKTSMSAAVATAFADRGQTTLIVSTDPAHSLSDAFGQSVAGGDPVAVMGIDNLYAQEVDPDSMKRTFKMMSEMGGGDIGGTGMDDMGLDDLNSLFDTIPPGFDEAVALVEIVKYIQGDAAYARFERIVFDTAPTGHTLRLLALPDFLNGFFGKIISMKSKFGNVMNQFKGMFGAGEPDMNASVQEIEELKRSMSMVRDLFRDEVQTEFVVATIPNMMAIAESGRLVQELKRERIPVRHLFVNQVQPSNDGCTFCAARHKEQNGNMQYIQREFETLQISTVQSFDKEIKGAGALRAMAMQLFPAREGEATREGSGENITAGAAPHDGTAGAARAEAELVE